MNAENKKTIERLRKYTEDLEASALTECSAATDCYAYRELNGEIDLDSISDTPENVRLKYLEMCMGWRFTHPDRYNHDEEWQRLLTYGSVVPVRVSVVDA